VQHAFLKGLKDGLAIALGYFSVSFGFGIMAINAGLSVSTAVLISATNLTSAGQVAGVGIIAAGGAYIEMFLSQLIINIRYALMGLSLSQKLDDSFHTPQRLIASFGITDEIFAVAASQQGRIPPAYLYGLIIIAFFGWTGGTLLGASAGEILPQPITNALGIMLYGMFLAIIMPAARESRGALVVIVIAAACSMLFYYVFSAVSQGFAIIISAVVAAAVGALLLPVKDDEEEE